MNRSNARTGTRARVVARRRCDATVARCFRFHVAARRANDGARTNAESRSIALPYYACVLHKKVYSPRRGERGVAKSHGRARVKTWVWSAWKTIDGDSHSPTSMRDDAAARTLLLAPAPPSAAPPLADARQAPRKDSDVATRMDPHATNAAHTPAEAPKKAR